MNTSRQRDEPTFDTPRRHAYHCSYDPLTLHSIPSLPPASTLGLAQPPPTPLGPPPLV
jgi:hypothetical protein